MTGGPWWERWPGRLECELAALDAAGIRWELDEAARARGVLSLALVVPTDEGNLTLRIVFPDLYPYFRFLAYAPTLDLPYHQNPFERNLCLIPRRTHYWDTTDTVAGQLLRQLPKLIATARSTDPPAEEGIEHPQAEPISEYYRYQPSMLLVQSDWTVSRTHRYGQLLIGTQTPLAHRAECLIRGAILEVRAEDGTVLCHADEQLRAAYAGRTLDGLWARVDHPIRESHEGKFIEELIRLQPHVSHPRPNHVEEGWLRIWGVLFPEQVAYRSVGDGWVFACALDSHRPSTPPPHAPHFQQARTKRSKKTHRGR
jgi:hypothetical protein